MKEKTKYWVFIENEPVTENGTPKEFTRSEATRYAKANNGKFRKTTTDATAVTRRTFRLSDTDMDKLGMVAKKKFKTTDRTKALRGLIYEAYDQIQGE